MAEILLIGLDTDLLLTRELALGETGAEIVSSKVEPALSLLAGRFYDIVVLCHTLSEQDVHRVCRIADLYWPLTRVLIITDGAEQTPLRSDADGAISWHSKSFALVQLIRQLLSEGRARQPREAMIIPIDTSLLYSELRTTKRLEPLRH